MSRLQIAIISISIFAVIAGLALLVVPRFLTPATTTAPMPTTNSTTEQNTGTSAVADVGKAAPGEKIIVLSKLGMTWSSCKAVVGSILSKVDGVVKYSVVVSKDEATVRYDTKRTTPAKIKAAIIKGGYQVGSIRER